MKIGLIARADNTGLGIQSKGFYDNIQCTALVVDMSPMGPGLQMLIPDLGRYPGQRVVKVNPPHHLMGWMPKNVINEFLDGLDVVFAMETPYDYSIFALCRARGIKTILQPNYEFLDFPSGLPTPDLFAAPSLWNFNNIPEPKIFLPVPVNTNHFTHNRAEKTFVHVAGRPAVHDRNGTMTLIRCLEYVKSNITVIVRSQRPLRVNYAMKPNINLIVDHTDKKNYFENYTGGVLVMPRKFGGLCLPMNEALAAGMPVIATDIEPNNLWLPKEWLVPASKWGEFPSKKRVQVYDADLISLAEKIDEFCDPQVYNAAIEKTKTISEEISWNAMASTYKKVFESL